MTDLNKPDLNQQFHDAYAAVFSRHTVYTDTFPVEMKASEKDAEGWLEWKLLKGTLQASHYHQIEKRFGVLFPESFIDWHRSYYFLEGDCSIIRLPVSSPTQPLHDLKQRLDWPTAKRLIAQQLYPFADEGNDTGPLVFDGREERAGNEFPIRVYDHEFCGEPEGLTPVVFSSFPKLLECLTHYLIERKTRPSFEIIADFFRIDPQGAGKTGVDYWLGWSAMQRANFEQFGY